MPTVEPQFKLYASKFPIWWTHNSIDKPDPDYFKGLEDQSNQDGFNWVEVPFTFNFKNQFEGTLIVDDQYYTYFKLVDAKDVKFPNRYYLVETLNKAFNGGYELSIRLDVFTSYGLDFWTNGVTNPDIMNKTVNLNRTNHAQLLLDNYYNYDGVYTDFNNWCYQDPLLKFDALPEINLVASSYGIQQKTDPDTGMTIPVNYIPWHSLSVYYKYTWNGSGWDRTTTPLYGSFVINGADDVSYNAMLMSMVRYYVFKPLIGDDDQYWAIWTISPRTWGEYPKGTLRAISSNSAIPSFKFNGDANSVLNRFIHSNRGFANKLVGVFEGPPLSILGNRSFAPSLNPADGKNYPYMIETSGLQLIDGGTVDTFLVSKIYITPDRISGYLGNFTSQTTNNGYFSIINVLSTGQNVLNQDLKNKLFSNDNAIRFINSEVEANTSGGEEFRLYNNPYILQKAHIDNLTYTPLYPGGVYQKNHMKWETALVPYNLPTQELAQIKTPDTFFFTSSGFRFGYISNYLNINKTLWTGPTSIGVGSDEYAQYMGSVLINQNNSMAIAKQQRDLGIADAVMGGVSAVAGGAISGGPGGIFSAITGLANMGLNIAKNEIAYQNKQKTIDAQNATARATMSTTINNTVDTDSAKQIFNTGLFIRGDSNDWASVWNKSFNWIINAKVPTLKRDIIHYNNVVYLNGFFVDCQIKISDLVLNWDNKFNGTMPHLYYDFDIGNDIIKLHYKTLNLELLNAVTIIFNNGIRFWKKLPDYSIPWYWIPASWADYDANGSKNKVVALPSEKPAPVSPDIPPPDTTKTIGGGTATVPNWVPDGWKGGGYTGGGMFR